MTFQTKRVMSEKLIFFILRFYSLKYKFFLTLIKPLEMLKGVFELGENCFRKSFSIKPECLAVTENIIFQKMTSG